MNQWIRRSQAISYIWIAAALLLFLLIWPAKLIKPEFVSKSDEVVAQESDAVSVAHNVTQMFVAEGETLSAVDLYVCNDMHGETITFRLYDASYQELFNTCYQVREQDQTPGFVHIPVHFDLIKDQEYYYTLEGLSADLYVNFEDTQLSTSMVNGIMAYDGLEVPGLNVIARYEYTNSYAGWQILLIGLILAAIATGLVCLTRFIFHRFLKKQDKSLTIGCFLRIVLNPCIIIGTCIFLYLVFPGRKFGTGITNYAFYGGSFLMLAAVLLFYLNGRPGVKGQEAEKQYFTMKSVTGRIPGFLQAVAFCGMLWSCFEYMNGLYDIHHAYAVCKLLIWFCLALITTYQKKEILSVFNLVWLIAGSILAYFYAKPYMGIEEQGELHKLQAFVIVVGGFVIINTISVLIRLFMKKIHAARPNWIYMGMVALLLILLTVFSNTRTWPAFLAVLCILFYLRMSVWEKRDHLPEYFCNGILLNFICMVLFSLWHRPYHYYIYYRYNMMYHTVTMTAVHLTLVMAAAAAKFFTGYEKKKTFRESIPSLCFLGMASAYLIFTLSRTGYVAACGMLLVLLVFVSIVSARQENKWVGFLKRTGLMILSVLVLFPITFTLTRTVPSLVDEPVIYEIEPCEATIHKGEASSSELYITINRFFEVFSSKVLGVGEDVTSDNRNQIQQEKEPVLLVTAGDATKEILLANAEDSSVQSELTNAEDNLEKSEPANEELSEEASEKSDVTNGRLDIFKKYIEEWNLTGHTDMGVMLQDGTVSVHAHNIFLQVIHDQGLITGIYFVIFLLATLVFSLLGIRKNGGQKGILCAAVLIGFMAAGMAEWIFHPCNPFGLSVFIVITPLLFSDKAKKKEYIDETEKTI